MISFLWMVIFVQFETHTHTHTHGRWRTPFIGENTNIYPLPLHMHYFHTVFDDIHNGNDGISIIRINSVD